MTQRTDLFNGGDYSLHATITPTTSPRDGHALTFTSRWMSAANPQEEQVRFQACLDRPGLQALSELIAQAMRSEVPRDRP